MLIISCASAQSDQHQYEEVKSKSNISLYGNFSQKTENEQLKRQAERDAYELTKSNNSEESYKEFINYFPNGTFAQDARNALIELERNKKYQLMTDAYSVAKANNTLQSYINFLKIYPGYDNFSGGFNYRIEAMELYNEVYNQIYNLSIYDEFQHLQRQLISKKWDSKLLNAEIDYRPFWESTNGERLIDLLFVLHQNPAFVNITHKFNSNSKLLTLDISLDVERVEIILRLQENKLIPRKHTARYIEQFDQNACVEMWGFHFKNKQEKYDAVFRKHGIKK
jgi:hypothetical protein